MKSSANSPDLERLLEPLGQCLTNETAARLLQLRADARLQTRVTLLAKKSNRGTLTSEERAEYESYVMFGTFIAILKSKARQLLAKESGVA